MKINCTSLYPKVLMLFLGLSALMGLSEAATPVAVIDTTSPAGVEFLLDINPRQADALSGSLFAASIQALDLFPREALILSNIRTGNIPQFLRVLIPVETNLAVDGKLYKLIFFVMPDYVSIGSDTNHVLIPMTPMLAQKVVDEFGGILPTRKMVNLIWEASVVKLTPEPIPPSEAMVTFNVFLEHNSMVETSRRTFLTGYPRGSLVSGHKKDVILSNRIASKPDKVIIYGWHYPDGNPIQPLYSGHVNWYADYSHGIRVILNKCLLNDSVVEIAHILKDPNLYKLLSDEAGAMETTRYDTARSNYP
jgi:hypothetical protein